jgi:Asp-tRNA(Asn)/Glu-tRNA(Gln) amidotransferase A subunit family amidase
VTDIQIPERIPTLFHRDGAGLPIDPLEEAGMMIAMCRNIVGGTVPRDAGRACSEFKGEKGDLIHKQEGKDIVIDAKAQGSRWRFTISMHELDPRTSSHHNLTNRDSMRKAANTALETLRRLVNAARTETTPQQIEALQERAVAIADEIRSSSEERDVFVNLATPWSAMNAGIEEKTGDNLLDERSMRAWATPPSMECRFASGISSTLTFSPISASRHGEIDPMTALRCLKDLPPLPSTGKRTAT